MGCCLQLRRLRFNEAAVESEGVAPMWIYRSADEFVVHAPAKLNLFFEVLARRADGYHEIESLMCPISLYDTLCFKEDSDGQIELECGWVAGQDGRCEFESLPQGRDNLVFRAVELLKQRAGVVSGARLRLIKRIPAAAGLGGGSSDAAAALAVANRGWGLGWPQAKLAQLAAQLGSDVPFFLGGGSAICRGRGERIERISEVGAIHFVVVRPPVGLSTAAVYGVCRPAAEPMVLAPLLQALGRGDLSSAGRLMFNRLESAAERLTPWIERTREAFARLDCLGHGMSGSGTSYFGLCRHARHARRIARRLQAGGAGSVFAVLSCR